MKSTKIKNFTLGTGKNKLKITDITRAPYNSRLYNMGVLWGQKRTKYVYSLLPKNVVTGRSYGRQYIYANSKVGLNKKIKKRSKKNFKW
ncbi:hypothetical protein LCGC14_1131100 [marine sediment metagenome]|uniref:Uncharacterized protein n=1 Tax=marine sediment metagenome TaxID=412755 RepID=A0A0F9MNV3_9ZZZZ